MITQRKSQGMIYACKKKPEKAKPVVRRGRKATGLLGAIATDLPEKAGLPIWGDLALLFLKPYSIIGIVKENAE